MESRKTHLFGFAVAFLRGAAMDQQVCYFRGVCEHLRESKKYQSRHRSDNLCTIIGKTASSEARREDED